MSGDFMCDPCCLEGEALCCLPCSTTGTPSELTCLNLGEMKGLWQRLKLKLKSGKAEDAGS